MSAFDKEYSFIVGEDYFTDLEIRPTSDDNFYYFYNKSKSCFVKHFFLDIREKVAHVCSIKLIKSNDKFTPRLALSIRDKTWNIQKYKEEGKSIIKANVNLSQCHENFWKLVSYLQSIQEIEVPKESFSLTAQDDAEIVNELRGRGNESIKRIIKLLLGKSDVVLTESDVNMLLKRRDKLNVFKNALNKHSDLESWWKNFFEGNKWIFGYGLNYEIHREVQPQPYLGGTRLDGTGGERGDNLMSSCGDLNFTVLVEIKTPATDLLRGKKEIRRGAWGLSRELSDALVQLQANIQTWELEGSSQVDNRDALERNSIFTVKPKGIIVIGRLLELNDRNKRDTFQRFRRSIHGIDIITFDELYNRAKFIVENE